MTSIVDIPLFPLNMVLFPGAPLTLHIFEDRYKQMMSHCLHKQEPFGVALIQEGVEALGPLAKPHSIGCTAKILQMQPLEEGKMNILAVGQERFRILELKYDLPYLVASIEPYPFPTDDPRALRRADRQLRPWVERYVRTLSEAGNVEFNPDQLPADVLPLAYMAAALLQIPSLQKQALLDSEQSSGLLETLIAVYRREVALLEAMAAQSKNAPDAPFSLN